MYPTQPILRHFTVTPPTVTFMTLSASSTTAQTQGRAVSKVVHTSNITAVIPYRYTNRDICFGYNEEDLTIYDADAPDGERIISVTGYTGAEYTHQVYLRSK